MLSNHQDFIRPIEAIAQNELAPLAPAIDRGHYPLEIMAKLGAAGAFAAQNKAQGERFDWAIDSLRAISRACGTTGFISWTHIACALYLDQSPNPALKGTLLEQHTWGKTFGGTGLSNAMKAWTNIEPMAYRAQRVDGGYIINGTLPWVSHIGQGQYCGAAAQVEGQEKRYDIMFLLRIDERVVLKECPDFSGMQGSGTWAIPLKDYFVPDSDIIADPAKNFIFKIRPAFILTQMGIGLGIIEGCIDDIRSVENQLGHVNQFLEDQAGGLQDLLDATAKQTRDLAQTPFASDKDYLLDVIDLRIQGARYSLRAAEDALLHTGARGYLADAAPQRRVREAQFVAIVTPAIKHLRYLAHQLMTEELPA